MAKVVVTGTSRGIRYELVKWLAAGGHSILSLSRNPLPVEELGLPGVTSLPFDITDPAASDTAASWVGSNWGRADGLIHNAGSLVNKPFRETRAEDFEAVYRVNVFGVANLTRAMLPVMDRGSTSVEFALGAVVGIVLGVVILVTTWPALTEPAPEAIVPAVERPAPVRAFVPQDWVRSSCPPPPAIDRNLGQRLEATAEFVKLERQRIGLDLDAHEIVAVYIVGVETRFENPAAMFRNQTSDARDDAGLVRAGRGQRIKARPVHQILADALSISARNSA